MTTAATSGLTTGAAGGFVSGAVIGASYGSAVPLYGTLIGGVVGAIVGGLGGWLSGSSADSQFSNQQAWSMYNARMQYDVALGNIFAQTMLANYNANLAMQAGQIRAGAILDTAAYNSGIIRNTVDYNDTLLEEELSLMWEASELDLMLIEQQRARERGTMVATQAASGTVIGEGSNADVIVDQKTQEALDTFVIRHGADIQASKIQNARAQSRWQGEVQIQKTLWEGELGAYVTMANASLQASGIRTSAAVSGLANMQSAKFGLQSAFFGQEMASSAFSANNTQNLVSGMFSAAASGASAYAAMSTPQTTNLSMTGTGTGVKQQASFMSLYNKYNNSNSGAGSSLLNTSGTWF